MSEKIVQVGQIGFGRFGKETLYHIFKNSGLSRVVAVADIDPQARNNATNLGLPNFGSPVDMLTAHPEIQHFAIAVPHEKQLSILAQLANAAVKQGLTFSVAAEKPLASNLKGAAEAAQILQQTFKLGAVFTRFSYPPFVWGLKNIGTIGAIQKIQDFVSITGPQHVFEPYVHSPDGRGNAILNGYHTASVLAILSGLPDSVTAQINNHGLQTNVDDTANIHAKYPASTGEYRCIWGITEKTVAKIETAIVGTAGTLTIEQWGNCTMKLNNEDEVVKEFEQPDDFIAKHDAGATALHLTILKHLLNSGETKLPHTIKNSLAIGLTAQAIVELGYLSSNRGGEAVTPQEVAHGVMNMNKLREYATQALLPISTSA